MDIKIQRGVGEGAAADAVKDAASAADSAAEIQETPVPSSDAVERIAAELASGEIGRKEAVERLIGEVLGSHMVSAAPKAVREELAEVLDALIQTNPYLRSLSAAIGPIESE